MLQWSWKRNKCKFSFAACRGSFIVDEVTLSVSDDMDYRGYVCAGQPGFSEKSFGHSSERFSERPRKLAKPRALDQ